MISVEHSGVTITYIENGNKWQFELRGRERSAESLEKAKEAIDKPVKEKEEKPFHRQKAYVSDYSASLEVCEVTSVAEGRAWSNILEFWVSCNGKRQKKPNSSLYAFNVDNQAKVAAYQELDKQISALEKKQNELKASLEQFKI